MLCRARPRLGAAAATSQRMASMAAMNSPSPKREGDISDSFASLAGINKTPLPERFRDLKLSLVAGHEQTVADSWVRLLATLKKENDKIASLGPKIVPEIRFSHLKEDMERSKADLKKHGVAVIRGVIPEKEARSYKDEIEQYVKNNPAAKGFPPENPQVFELYWSGPQLKARSHPNLLQVQRSLLNLWHVSDPKSLVNLSQPLSYADRLRIRQPGDARFALGPHQDGGSVERWERNGYGKSGVYEPVFAGKWEEYDAWDAGQRVQVISDLYGGLGACSVFRAFQGWLSMSRVGPSQGTLLVNPLAELATAYTLLRPFFKEIRPLRGSSEKEVAEFLAPENWQFTAGAAMTSDLQGATPGHGQEFPSEDLVSLHPHLELNKTMVHVPDVVPGDFVVWHCDTIHSVDPIHRGKGDSSVLYIPVSPVTEVNANYFVRQREAFLKGTPGPDFPGGQGETGFVGRPTIDAISGQDGLRAMGLEKLSTDGLAGGALEVTQRANKILGFE